MSSGQAVFPPDVLARIAPDVSLERHLALGLRPCLRKVDEFRPLSASLGSFNNLGTNSLVGLATVRNGEAYAFCGISVGVSERMNTDDLLSGAVTSKYSTVYPIVEISRGRTGAPTDEEMILSQKLHDQVFHLKILPLLLLELTPGYELTNEDSGNTYVVYPDGELLTEEDVMSSSSTVNVTKKKFKYLLYAHIKVFSRSGPLFDLVHYALMAALRNVTLPKVFMADSGIDPNIRVPVRSRGNFGHLSQTSSRFCIDADQTLAKPLVLALSEISLSSSFGLIDLTESDTPKSVLLSDLEGEAEEACTESKITICTTEKSLKHVSIIGGGANVTLETIQKASRIAKNRLRTVKP